MVAVYNYGYVAKLIIIGDMGCGKSSLLRQFTEDTFSEKTNHTIGVEFGTKIVEVDGERVKIQAWDTAGQERFRSVTRSYYRGSIGTIFVYDITNRESFENLDKWLVDARQLTAPHSIFVLVGNKADQEARRAVSTEEGQAYAQQHGMLFVEASAKTGNKVESTFVLVASKVIRLVKDGVVDPLVPDSGVQSKKPQDALAAAASLDIKSIADKTAEHVAKSGDAFQQLIRDKYQGNAKFSFIQPNDPYHAYYEHMVEKFKLGAATNDSVTNTGSATDISNPMDVDASATQETEAPEQPNPLQFAHAMPAISAQDLDVIKLTAQFVARNGRQFMTALAQREAQNYQFDFLSPTHSLFAYFRKLVDQYTLVFYPPAELTERLTKDKDNKYRILDRVNRRMKWAAFEEEERRRKGQEAEREKEAFLSIDWHDFVVVGTVEFVEEDSFVDLPGPLRLQDLASMSLEDKHKHNAQQAVANPAAAMAGLSLAPMDSAAKPAVGASEAKHISVDDQDDDEDNDVEMDMDDEEDDEHIDEELEAERNPKAMVHPPASALAVGPMKIRKDYVPNLRRGPQIAKVTLQCQLCRLEIPAAEFEEHIRVELIDPKWKEQKLVYERRLRDSNLVQEGMDIARYLKQMASHRSDIFGTANSSEQDAQAPASSAGTDPATGAQRIYWDGYSSTAGQATRRARENMTAEERVAAAHRKKGLADPRDSSLQIGPQMESPTPKRQKK
ncbi:SF3a splicing factor complex subunit [Coemansia sp. RSA 2322]|nr:SF3a splicing factor complex subunit [Coemansia sp. RSA 2322]